MNDGALINAYLSVAKRMGLTGTGIMLYSPCDVKYKGETGRWVSYGNNSNIRLWVMREYALMEMR